MKCLRCGRDYAERPAISRRDRSDCLECGILEALDAAGWSQEEKEEAIRLAREGVKQIKNASSKLVPIQGGK